MAKAESLLTQASIQIRAHYEERWDVADNEQRNTLVRGYLCKISSKRSKILDLNTITFDKAVSNFSMRSHKRSVSSAGSPAQFT